MRGSVSPAVGGETHTKKERETRRDERMMSRSVGLVLLLWVSCVAQGWGPADARGSRVPRRGLQSRPITATTTWFTQCDNTIETRDNVTDDKGALCSRENLNYETGCCPSEFGIVGDCSRCKQDECCDTYAHCVSCCMGPTVNAQSYLEDPNAFKVLLHPETGKWSTKWEYCTGQCRVTPLGTWFENKYKTPHHFCYGLYPMPTNTEYTLPAEVKVEMGLRGESCDSVCSQKGMRCSAAHLEEINLCEVIRETQDFKCKYCKIKDSAGQLGGPAVQKLGNDGVFDGICLQEKKVHDLRCDREVTEAYNRVCPCV